MTMKNLVKMICATLPLVVGIAFGGTQTTITQTSSTQTATSSSWMPQYDNKVYTQVGGGYISSNNFHGGGGMLRVGYNLNEYLGWKHEGSHNIEFEFDFLFSKAQAGFNISNVILITTETPPNILTLDSITQSRKVYLNQFPLILNYRFMWCAKEMMKKGEAAAWWNNLGVYAGAGLGVNIINTVNHYNRTWLVGATGKSDTYTSSNSKTTGQFLGQVFAGGSYNFTDRFSATAGMRLIFSEKNSFGGEPVSGVPGIVTPGMHTSILSWTVEGALSYLW
jgi:hypothetical protein